MLFRNAFIALSAATFLIGGADAQFTFDIAPGNTLATFNFVDGMPSGDTITVRAAHTDLAGGTIAMAYYAAGCAGSALTAPTGAAVANSGSTTSGTTSDTTATLANLSAFRTTSGTTVTYNFCVRYGYTSSDQGATESNFLFLDVDFTRTLDGSTNVNTINSVPTGSTTAGPVTDDLKVLAYVCDSGDTEITEGPGTTFNQGAQIRICLESEVADEALITSIESFSFSIAAGGDLSATSQAAFVDGDTVTAGTIGTIQADTAYATSCVSAGIAKCSFTIILDTVFYQFDSSNDPISADVAGIGEVNMVVVSSRRRELRSVPIHFRRSLLQPGDAFTKAASTTFVVNAADDNDDSCSFWCFLFSCFGLF